MGVSNGTRDKNCRIDVGRTSSKESFEVRLVSYDALCDTMCKSTGLAGGSASTDDREDVVLAQDTGDFERTGYPFSVCWQREEFVQRDIVHEDGGHWQRR